MSAAADEEILEDPAVPFDAGDKDTGDALVYNTDGRETARKKPRDPLEPIEPEEEDETLSAAPVPKAAAASQWKHADVAIQTHHSPACLAPSCLLQTSNRSM